MPRPGFASSLIEFHEWFPDDLPATATSCSTPRRRAPHLQAYLDEFVFRFNRRQNPMAAFQTLLGLGSSRTPVRRATIRMAQALSYCYEGDEIDPVEAGRL